jgi:hypothetical protein
VIAQRRVTRDRLTRRRFLAADRPSRASRGRVVDLRQERRAVVPDRRVVPALDRGTELGASEPVTAVGKLPTGQAPHRG